MPQSTYITETDPSGALIEELDSVQYTNFDLSFVPLYGETYVARDEKSNNVTELFRPYIGAGAIEWPGVMAVDNNNNVYVANEGTNPRNSRISKIYLNYFHFDNVILENGTCSNAQIYNLTLRDYVDVNYNDINPTTFPIPFPYPIPNSTIPVPIVPIPVPTPPSPLPQPQPNG